MSYIYLASPYSDPDPAIVQRRYHLVLSATASLLRDCIWTYSPIVHCHELARLHSLPTDFAFWRDYNKAMLQKANAIALLDIPGWENSKGVKDELQIAELLAIPFRVVKITENKVKLSGKKKFPELA